MLGIRRESRNNKRFVRKTYYVEEIVLAELARRSASRHCIQNPLNYHQKLYISLCECCKKGIIINTSRHVKYCSECSKKRARSKQAEKRAILSGRHLCQHCKKPLPKKYPNRVFCPGGACKQAAYRERRHMKNG